jgi:hypothetical protein
MRNRILTIACLLACLVAVVSPAPAVSVPLPAATLEQDDVARASATAGSAPEVTVQTPSIEWGTSSAGNVPYSWNARVDNPYDRPVVVKLRLDFVTDQGEVVHEDLVSGHIGPNESVVLQQKGSLPERELDMVAEARGVPEAHWGDQPAQIRTIAAFVDGLQRLEVFIVLEDWRGRPITAAGTVDMYVVERERLRAEFDGGGMRRRLTTLYARRFDVSTRDFARRRIGFISTDYTPPALTLGPIHYSIFDHEPRGDEGLVRIVFHALDGTQIVAEDRVFF